MNKKLSSAIKMVLVCLTVAATFGFWQLNVFAGGTVSNASATGSTLSLTVEGKTDANVKAAVAVQVLDESENVLMMQSITVKDGSYVGEAVEISGYDMISKLPHFKEGFFFVQDESSMLSTEAAEIKKGDFVLDVCAAPGGKATFAATKLMLLGGGEVRARDLTKEKVRLINENTERLGLTNIKAEIWDATVPDEKLLHKCDVVIADLPCSGLGIMAKKPEIRYRMTKESMDELAKLQRKILDVVCEYVKPGGRLVYSTCTINKEENESNADYIAGKPGFERIKLNEVLKTVPKERFGADGTLQLLPGIDESDGFFVSAFTYK